MTDERCKCGHEARYHGPKGGCRFPVAPRGEDCGCLKQVSPFLVNLHLWTANPETKVQEIWDCVEKSSSCWIWTGPFRSNGYGVVKLSKNGRRKEIAAHRAVYELSGRRIPADLVLDHLCRTPACVNPDHLEPVTNRENIRRGEAPSAVAARTGVCVKGGHDLTDPGNVWVARDGKRRCRRCIELRRLKQLAEVGTPNRPHGTNAAYGLGCRCDECRQAHTDYERERTARKRRP